MPAPIPIGHVEAIFRYPVKSMAAEPLASADLGFNGLEGDRRFALRRLHDRSDFPWLNASKFPDLIRYTPLSRDPNSPLPTHVRTPEGEEFPIASDDLAHHIAHRHGAPVQMLHLRHGIFDDAMLSLIASATIREIERLSRPLDSRRFRPNLVLHLDNPVPFAEDRWIGVTLTIGPAAVAVTTRDLRCAMVNLDPDTARSTPDVLKAIARANQTNAGVYAAVIRAARISLNDPVSFTPVSS